VQRRTLLSLSAASLIAPHLSYSHDVNHQGKAPTPADPTRVPVRIIDRPVIDQDGHQVSFGRDVVADKLVVIDFIYTSCGTLCPLQSSLLSDLQEHVGDRLGRDVTFISLSIDPTVDNPARLKSEAEKFDAKAGWHFLTGKPKDIEVILTGMQAYVETPEDHPGFFLIGSSAEDVWSKLDGLPSPDLLYERLNDADRARARRR
jgi:protein SCO1/2